MANWRVSWTQEGFVDVEADSKDDAFAAFERMSGPEICEMGDCWSPEAYSAEEWAEDNYGR
jgi:hypothetical protein